jgi:glycosyl transferase family 25
MKAYFINLDRSLERCHAFRAGLAALGMEATRVPAVDGRKLTLPMVEVDADDYRRCHGRELRLSEVGCYLSHLAAMRVFLKSSAPYGAIFEDDAEVHQDLPRVLAELEHNDLRGFDVVRLDYRRPGIGFNSAHLDTGHAIRINLTRCTGAAGYVLNRHAAECYLSRLLPMRVPFDHAFDRALHLGLRIGNVCPALVKPWPVLSTINGASSSGGKVRGLAKAPVLLWRAETEIARGFYAAREFLR